MGFLFKVGRLNFGQFSRPNMKVPRNEAADTPSASNSGFAPSPLISDTVFTDILFGPIAFAGVGGKDSGDAPGSNVIGSLSENLVVAKV